MLRTRQTPSGAARKRHFPFRAASGGDLRENVRYALSNFQGRITNHGGSVAYGPLRFESGGTIYGTFPFTEICKVLNSDFKCGHIARTMPNSDDANIVLKTIDPIASPTLMQY